jgi:ABC-type sugar transport system ATPase subunit
VLNAADRIAVLYLGRMAAVEPVEQVDTASIVELMTTGRSDRTHPPAGQVQAGQHAGEVS